MDTTRISLIAALAAVVAWALKGVAIGLAGGLGKSPLEGPLFLAGLACFVVAACSLALSVVRRRDWWVQAAAVAGAVATVVAVAVVSGSIVDAVASGGHWAWSELSLWLSSLALLGLAAWRSTRRAPSPA
jgi:hypothetical protein